MNKHINTSGFFLIENILSKHECDTYINDINILFDKNPDPEGLLYDKYNRVRINNQIMSEFIGGKIHKYFDSSKYYIYHKWFPTKYINGGGLETHSDGTVHDNGNISCYTIIIYLNDNYDDGRTIFLNSEKDIEVVPKAGNILILEQDKPHYAEDVKNGVKYILRGDIFLR